MSNIGHYNPNRTLVTEPHPLLVELGAAALQLHPMQAVVADSLRDWMRSALDGIKAFEKAGADALVRAADFVLPKRFAVVEAATRPIVSDMQALCRSRLAKARQAAAVVEARITEATAEPALDGHASVVREMRRSEARARLARMDPSSMQATLFQALNAGSLGALWAAQGDPLGGLLTADETARLQSFWIKASEPALLDMREDAEAIENTLIKLIAKVWERLAAWRGSDAGGVIAATASDTALVPPLATFVEQAPN